MYFEFSTHKLAPLAFATSVLTAGILLFVYTNATWAVVNRGAEYLYRAESNIAYALFYRNIGAGQAAAVALGSSANASSTGAQAVPVLIYHGTPPEGNDNPPLPQNVFIEQLKSLKAAGWNTITLEQFEAFMKNGTPVPQKSFLLTFDDARKESFYPADPVLKDLGYTAVMFTITGFSLPPDGEKPSTFYLNKTELQYMIDSGRWEIESHGAEDHRLYDIPLASPTTGQVTTLRQEHFLSNKFWLPNPGRIETNDEYIARVTNDLRGAKTTLEKTFGKPITAYAYPFNDYGQESKNFPDAVATLSNITSAIYNYTFYQVDQRRNDPFNYPDPKAYMIKRIEPTASWSGAYLVHLLESNQAKALPYHSDGVWTEWNANWGDVQAVGNVLALHSSAQATGATALLNGSELWKNYWMSATVDWKSGNAISLVARYQSDSKSFLSCAFTEDHILLEGHENGKQTTIIATQYTFAGKKDNAQFGMKVVGNLVTCYTSGKNVSARVKESYLHTGSTGIQIWDPVKNNAAVDVKTVSVTQAYE
jgi:peptidoglycan/xylan/chitin deacetylase (PgdA/CDA1 family)